MKGRCVMQDHLTYFIKAVRYNWVKVGRSRDIFTTDKRIQAIAGREPFEVQLMGVSSTVAETEAHRHLKAHRIRSEWFRWNKDVSRYVKRVADLYCCSPGGDDGWDILLWDATTELQNEQTRKISEQLYQLTPLTPPHG